MNYLLVKLKFLFLLLSLYRPLQSKFIVSSQLNPIFVRKCICCILDVAFPEFSTVLLQTKVFCILNKVRVCQKSEVTSSVNTLDPIFLTFAHQILFSFNIRPNQVYEVKYKTKQFSRDHILSLKLWVKKKMFVRHGSALAFPLQIDCINGIISNFEIWVFHTGQVILWKMAPGYSFIEIIFQWQ